jgi:hypothetical protein
MNIGFSSWYRLGFGLALSLVSFQLAAFERLDDSASPRSVVSPQVVMSEQGRALADSFDARNAVVQYGRIEYRLAMKSYVGRHVRIYFVVPFNIPGLISANAVRLDWRGYSGLNDGSARPGEHVLVWSGVVREAWMNVGLDLSMHIDLSGFDLPSRDGVGFESYFEVEPLS